MLGSTELEDAFGTDGAEEEEEEVVESLLLDFDFLLLDSPAIKVPPDAALFFVPSILRK